MVGFKVKFINVEAEQDNLDLQYEPPEDKEEPVVTKEEPVVPKVDSPVIQRRRAIRVPIPVVEEDSSSDDESIEIVRPPVSKHKESDQKPSWFEQNKLYIALGVVCGILFLGKGDQKKENA